MNNKYERKLDLIDYFPERGEFGKDSKEKELYLTCECGIEALKLNRFFGEDEIYLTIFKYQVLSLNFFARFKMTWRVIKGEGITTSEIVLSKKNCNK